MLAYVVSGVVLWSPVCTCGRVNSPGGGDTCVTRAVMCVRAELRGSVMHGARARRQLLWAAGPSPVSCMSRVWQWVSGVHGGTLIGYNYS